MAGRPISFQAPMIQALIEGRKTMTRRIVKLPKKTHSGGPIYEHSKMGGWAATTIGGGGCFTIGKGGERHPEPERPAIWHQTTGTCVAAPYRVGDLLWVRESFAIVPATAYRNSDGVAQTVDPNDLDNAAIYRGGFDRSGRPPWKPSFHMPRWASRITLKVTGVKIERVQDISEEDAIAEGVGPLCHPLGRMDLQWVGTPNVCKAPSIAFRDLWSTIHGPGAWEANPWVVVVSFDVIRKNVDEVAR